MFGKKRDISRQVFQIRYNIDIQLKILDQKTSLFNEGNRKDKKLLKEILEVQEKIQFQFHELELLMNYELDEIEVLEDEDNVEFLDEFTRELEILDDDDEKTEILDELTREIAVVKKKDELEELEILQDTMTLSLDSINNVASSIFSSDNNDVEILDDEFKQCIINHEQLQKEIIESKNAIDIKIKQIKLKKFLWSVIFSVSIICFIIVVIIIVYRVYNTFYNEHQISDLNNYITVEEIYDPVEKDDDVVQDITSSINQYIDNKVVDFDGLLKKNDTTRGWISVPNTNIDYPFAQAADNNFYLKHTFDKSFNYRGWIFLDYRNNFDTGDMNTIIYGHGLLDNTMFGSLKKVVTPSWYMNKDNHIVTIYTPNGYMKYQVFSTYTTLPENYYITPNFSNDIDYREFLNTIISRSVYDYNTNVNVNDKILTLSSCYDDEHRVVLHAKLIFKSY